jgi:hypothetical protein
VDDGTASEGCGAGLPFAHAARALAPASGRLARDRCGDERGLSSTCNLWVERHGHVDEDGRQLLPIKAVYFFDIEQ